MAKQQGKDIGKESWRFTIKDAATNNVYGGLENIPGNQGNLMLARLAPNERRSWWDLEVGEHVNLTENLIVVRVQ